MKVAVVAFSAVVLMSSAVLAQPKSHTNSGVREACAADIAKHCPNAAPGQATMQCVMLSRDKMSDGCKAAMAAMRGNAQGQTNGNPGGQTKNEAANDAKKDDTKPR
jgi:hypothetical protein